jgi:hypothetical protein
MFCAIKKHSFVVENYKIKSQQGILPPFVGNYNKKFTKPLPRNPLTTISCGVGSGIAQVCGMEKIS